MRNRQFQIRTVRRAIVAEIAKGYYRPAKPISPVAKTSYGSKDNGNFGRKNSRTDGSGQLALIFDPPQPLADIFPEAYK